MLLTVARGFLQLFAVNVALTALAFLAALLFTVPWQILAGLFAAWLAFALFAALFGDRLRWWWSERHEEPRIPMLDLRYVWLLERGLIDLGN
jgi:hypothetical protein